MESKERYAVINIPLKLENIGGGGYQRTNQNNDFIWKQTIVQ